MATVANILWRVGETWRIDATMHDSSGVPLSLVGAQVNWRLADIAGQVLETLSVGSGITLVNGGVDGECLIVTTPAMQVSMDIQPGVYQHEAQVILSDGTVTDQFAGFVQALDSLFP
jgi:hypothetical protein